MTAAPISGFFCHELGADPIFPVSIGSDDAVRAKAKPNFF
jgi:hypothetical protein